MTQQRNMSETATTMAMNEIQAAGTQGRGRTATMATRRGRRSAGTPKDHQLQDPGVTEQQEQVAE